MRRVRTAMASPWRPGVSSTNDNGLPTTGYFATRSPFPKVPNDPSCPLRYDRRAFMTAQNSTAQDSQASLFDTGDAHAFTERGTLAADCGFCAILRREQEVTLIDENDKL